jgi:heptose-I-phosphate ethanolaminephosphotransferase
MKTIGKIARGLTAPLVKNGTFFVMMYALGVLCAVLTLPHTRGAHLYDNLFLELFLDIYVTCAVLALLPQRVRTWVRRLLYVVLYAVAVVDVYCFWKFGSTLTPTMLLLVAETDAREASEFLHSYLSPDVVFSPVGWLLLLIVVHGLWAVRRRVWRLSGHDGHTWAERQPVCLKRRSARVGAALLVAVLLVASVCTSFHNKVGMTQLMSARTIGTVEHLLTQKDCGNMYLPVYRLAFSWNSNRLAGKQVGQCIAAAQRVTVDSCTFRSPTIVLILGESYGKQHSQQYGYFLKTTPRQVKREENGLLTRFSDVVSCWNLTSFVFKNILSMHITGEKGEWCDYPLFPELFRKAGYRVTFLTNQFLPKAKEAVYDFSGGFFLNDPTLSAAQFDLRNQKTHRFDEGLLKDYDRLVSDGKIKLEGAHNLLIFHLIGQHVNYRTRCPNSQRVFGPEAYQERRPDLSLKQRRILADYDNAVLYNDSIVDAIISRFENKDAIVIYMPDHGEECYEPGRGFICRNHSAQVDWPLAHYEFEVPFWIYCSHRYAVSHPQVFKAVKDAKDKRFMTDALPHMLVWLAGIGSKDYHDRYNLLSPDYDAMRPRILKNSADYDALREEALNDKKHE